MSHSTQRSLTPREVAKKMRTNAALVKSRPTRFKAFEAGEKVQKLLEKRGYIVRGEKNDNGAILSCRGVKIAVKVRSDSILTRPNSLTRAYVFQLSRELLDSVDIFVCIVGRQQEMYVFPRLALRNSTINISVKPAFTRYAQCWNEQFRNKVDLLYDAVEGQSMASKLADLQKSTIAMLVKYAPKVKPRSKGKTKPRSKRR